MNDNPTTKEEARKTRAYDVWNFTMPVKCRRPWPAVSQAAREEDPGMSITRIDSYPFPMAFIQECVNGRWRTWCGEFRGAFVPVECRFW